MYKQQPGMWGAGKSAACGGSSSRLALPALWGSRQQQAGLCRPGRISLLRRHAAGLPLHLPAPPWPGGVLS